MKIAISAAGKDLKSFVDQRFGRCPYFVIVEVNGEIKNVECIENTAAKQFGGAGITAAQLVGNKKVDAVITQNIGPRAMDVMKQLNIPVYRGEGRIKDVVQKFIEGKLEKIEYPTGPMFMGKS